MQKTLRKTIAFSVTIIQKTEERAKNLGMDFTDYVRYLLAREAEQNMSHESEPVYYMSDRTEKNVARARKEISEGKFKTFKDGKSAMKYIMS